MVSWPPDWQQRLSEALTKAGADGPCSRCGHEDIMLLDGYIGLPLQAKLGEGPSGSVTTIGTVCSRCGFLSQHVVEMLLAQELDATGTIDTPPGNGMAGA